MKRVCPFCKSELTVSSVYFCEYCGNVLPDDLQLEVEKPQFSKEIVSEEKPSQTFREFTPNENKNISLRSIMIGIVLGMLISGTIFLISKMDIVKILSFINGTSNEHLPTISIPTPHPQQKPKAEEKKNYSEMGLNLTSGPFGQHNIRTYIPYDASIYMEFNDSSTLDPYFSFLGGDFFTLVESLRGKIQSFYAVFYMKKGITSGDWVVLTFPIDKSMEIGDFKTISTDMVDDILVISPEPALIDDVKLAKAEVIKNISHHPALVSASPLIPRDGQIFILKVSEDGNAVIGELGKTTLSSEFKSVLENFIKSDFPHMVIK